MWEQRIGMKIWLKERDEVCQTFDVEKFKKFYRKWKKMGVYDLGLPTDEVIEIAMRKAVCNMTKADTEKKREAKKWLKDRGYSEGL